MIANPTLPDGMSCEEFGDGCQTISKPGVGGVTIDWRGRGWRRGWSTTGRLDSKVTFSGRGWQQRLLADAVRELQEASK